MNMNDNRKFSSIKVSKNQTSQDMFQTPKFKKNFSINLKVCVSFVLSSV